MKRFALVLAIVAVAVTLTSLDRLKGADASSGLANTTVLVIRHAEKPEHGSGLSPEGEQRAEAYAKYFAAFPLDQATLKPDYLVAAADTEGSHRSRKTLKPLSRDLGLPIDDRFTSKEAVKLVEDLKAKPHGSVILICWHHKQFPELLMELGVKPGSVLPGGEWPENTFNWVIAIRYGPSGSLKDVKRIVEHLLPSDGPASGTPE